jgi:amino acid transporter
LASTTETQPAETFVDTSAPGAKGLKADAIGYISNLVIAVASTAPAYSLAATLGFIVAVTGVGVHAPAVLIVSFIPILFVSVGYRFFNLADPDAGTTFAWVTRAFGPQIGWVNGWAIFLADIIVMASLAAIASSYTYALWNATPSNFGLIAGAVIWIVLMTWICYRGIELSARIQAILLGIEIFTLALFAVVALIKVYGGHAPTGSIKPAADWFNPFNLSWGALIDGVLLGIFIYWGWDSGVAVNEESRDRHRGPGKAAVLSTLILLAIYVIVTAAAQAFHGTKFLADNSNDVLNPLSHGVLGPFHILLIITVLTSASASTQTTILPTARTTLSMAKWDAIPSAFGRVHPRFFTPSFSTLLMGGLSIIWTVCLLGFNPSQNVLGDTISALGFSVCFYYGFTGIACAVYFRRDLLKSARNFFLAGVIPVVGGLMMGYVAIKAYGYYSTSGNNYAKPILGIQVPIFVGVGGLILGVILMFASWPFFTGFFSRRWWETSDPQVLIADAAHEPEPLVPGEPPEIERPGRHIL